MWGGWKDKLDGWEMLIISCEAVGLTKRVTLGDLSLNPSLMSSVGNPTSLDYNPHYAHSSAQH